MAPIRCRVKKAKDCLDGKDEFKVYDPEVGQADDGTWDGETVICDSCYIAAGMPTSNDPASLMGGRGYHGREPVDGGF